MFFRRQKQAPPSFNEELEAARKQGFTVEQVEGGRVRLSKAGCAAVVEPLGDGKVRLTEKPGIVVDGEIAWLLDRGYQKFLATRAGTRPALAEQLKAIHQFNAELRRVFRVRNLYNEALGTVSDRYYYDRVEGRD